jgi:Fic family protein
MIKFNKVEITPEILKIIAELDEFKGAWRFISHLKPDALSSLKKIATIESIGSSTRIEGSKLADREVEALLSGIYLNSFRSRDEQEVVGYALVCEEIFMSHDYISLTENYVKQLHAMLLKYSEKDERHRGEYKKISNSVEAFDASGKSLGVIFQTTAPFETPIQMDELIEWARQALEYKELHPLLVIGIFNVTFLAIHPFQDGNGRLSRLLTTLLLLKAGYSYVPYSSLESVIEDNKEGYYLSLRRTQKTLSKDYPEWTSWLTFFLRSLQKQKRVLESKIAVVNKELLELPELSAKIIELAHHRGRITITEILDETKANRNTIKKYLERLVIDTKLRRHGKGRGTWYTR